MVSKEDAQKYLSKVPSDKAFWVNNGPILYSLEELAKELDNMTDFTFTYHCSQEKNDFSRWVDDVIGDQKLAEDLRSAKTRTGALKKIQDRLKALKKRAG